MTVPKTPKMPKLGPVKFRSPQYDKVQEVWDKKYGGRSESTLTPAEIARKRSVRAWIDVQNNLRRKPGSRPEYLHYGSKKDRK